MKLKALGPLIPLVIIGALAAPAFASPNWIQPCGQSYAIAGGNWQCPTTTTTQYVTTSTSVEPTTSTTYEVTTTSVPAETSTTSPPSSTTVPEETTTTTEAERTTTTVAPTTSTVIPSTTSVPLSTTTLAPSPTTTLVVTTTVGPPAELAHTGRPVWMLILIGLALVSVGVATYLFARLYVEGE